jgi:O-antigen/teichoic acid export membrane protein
MGAQLVAGLGNLLVSLIAARMLGATAYAQVVTFLALYLMVNVPSAALTAAGAVDPRRTRRARDRAVSCAALAAVVIALASAPIGDAVGLPTVMVVMLAAALPGAAALGIARGEAYARHDTGAVSASLAAEPIVRAGLGVAAMALFGAPGAALAAVVGGYVAIAACAWTTDLTPGSVRLVRRRVDDPAVDAISLDGSSLGRAGHRAAVGVGMSFVLLAVIQVIDLVVANARLEGDLAGQFGTLSTIGGAAAFATATLPLVLLPNASSGNREARTVALHLALAIGALIAVTGWIAARPILELAVGPELAGGSRWLGPYLAAMAALGTARVVVAARWTEGDGRFAMGALITTVGLQTVALLAFATSVAAVVLCTVAAAAGLAALLAFAPGSALDRGGAPTATMPWTTPTIGIPDWARRAPAGADVRRWARTNRELLALAGLCVVAAVLRLATTRGLWVDEAISVRQAQLPFSEMIADVRDSDVHPPLHHAVLWLDVRLFGTSELAVRLPSLLAGVALVPALLWTGTVLYNRRTGWVAAGLGAIAPFCVWYSQEARMYSLFMLFATIAVGAQVQALRRGLRVDWLVYSAATAALAWTQYFAVLPVLVQQLAFAVAAFNRRRDRVELRTFCRNWAASSVLVVAALLPLLPFIHDQWIAYTNRSSGLVPGQAGAASSSIGGVISIYAVAANLIWAIWGYHADATMVQLAALWPLLMLLALVMLGRGRSRQTALLVALVAAPLAALFVVGSVKRDLFELRYFSGAVPMLLLLGARLVTVLSRAWTTLIVGAAMALTTLSAGLVDQQLNGANPRLYDFEGALAEVAAGDADDGAQGNDVLLYAPVYLGDVIEYYAPGLDTRPLGSEIPEGTGTVWVLASENVLSTEDTAGYIGGVLADLEEERTLVSTIRRPNVRVWELR